MSQCAALRESVWTSLSYLAFEIVVADVWLRKWYGRLWSSGGRTSVGITVVCMCPTGEAGDGWLLRRGRYHPSATAVHDQIMSCAPATHVWRSLIAQQDTAHNWHSMGMMWSWRLGPVMRHVVALCSDWTRDVNGTRFSRVPKKFPVPGKKISRSGEFREIAKSIPSLLV